MLRILLTYKRELLHSASADGSGAGEAAHPGVPRSAWGQVALECNKIFVRGMRLVRAYAMPELDKGIRVMLPPTLFLCYEIVAPGTCYL